MRLFVKYDEKYHKSRIFWEKISFSMQHFAIFHVRKYVFFISD